MSELTLKFDTPAQTAWATDKTLIRNIALTVLGSAGRRRGWHSRRTRVGP